MRKQLRLLAALLPGIAASAAPGLPALRGGVVQNCGQLDAPVHSYVDCGNATIYFTKAAVVLDLPCERRAIWMRFPGAGESTILELRDQQPARLNYFTGTDPQRWQIGSAGLRGARISQSMAGRRRGLPPGDGPVALLVPRRRGCRPGPRPI